jgi:hypothetical protein
MVVMRRALSSLFRRRADNHLLAGDTIEHLGRCNALLLIRGGLQDGSHIQCELLLLDELVLAQLLDLPVEHLVFVDRHHLALPLEHVLQGLLWRRRLRDLLGRQRHVNEEGRAAHAQRLKVRIRLLQLQDVVMQLFHF